MIAFLFLPALWTRGAEFAEKLDGNLVLNQKKKKQKEGIPA